MDMFFGKKYALTYMENYEEYLDYLGVNYIIKKVALNLKLVESLHCNKDGTYTLNVKCALFDWKIPFTPGVEFDQKKPDGDVVKATLTIEGNKLTHVQADDAGRVSTHLSEFFADKFITTTTATGFDKTVTRIYTLVK